MNVKLEFIDFLDEVTYDWPSMRMRGRFVETSEGIVTEEGKTIYRVVNGWPTRDHMNDEEC